MIITVELTDAEIVEAINSYVTRKVRVPGGYESAEVDINTTDKKIIVKVSLKHF